jgi:hypothetical protein
MAVEVLEFLDVEARRRLADLGEVEPLDRLAHRDHLVVAMAPAEAEEIVEQRLGEDPELVAIGVDAERAMALGELGAVETMDERDMGVDGLRPAHRPDDCELAEGVVEMVVAADDVGDSHVVIVDDHRQHVGRGPVGAEQDHVVELFVADGDPALDEVVDDGLPLPRSLEADDEGALAGGRAVAPGTLDPVGAALRLRLLAPGRQLLRRHVAAIGMASSDHFVGDLDVPGLELRLVIFVPVPVDSEPFQAVEDDVDRLLGGAGRVGILDAQERSAAMAAGVEPAEQAGAGVADMKEAGGRGRKAGDDLAGLDGCAQAPFLQGCLAMTAGDGWAPSIADHNRHPGDGRDA